MVTGTPNHVRRVVLYGYDPTTGTYIPVKVDVSGNILINITTQTLTEVTIRQKYGEGNEKAISQACPAVVVTSLCSVAGAGVVYFGHVYVAASSAHEDDEVEVYCDDNLVSSLSFKNLWTRHIWEPWSNVTYVICYETGAFRYCVGVGVNITFESSFKLKYDNKGADSVTPVGSLVYALV